MITDDGCCTRCEIYFGLLWIYLNKWTTMDSIIDVCDDMMMSCLVVVPTCWCIALIWVVSSQYVDILVFESSMRRDTPSCVHLHRRISMDGPVFAGINMCYECPCSYIVVLQFEVCSARGGASRMHSVIFVAHAIIRFGGRSVLSPVLDHCRKVRSGETSIHGEWWIIM
jgi:hypothetical protein